MGAVMRLTPVFGMVNFINDAHFRRIWRHPKKIINSRQKAWVHYMLQVWGNVNAGDDSPCGAINVIGRLMIRIRPPQSKLSRSLWVS